MFGTSWETSNTGVTPVSASSSAFFYVSSHPRTDMLSTYYVHLGASGQNAATPHDAFSTATPQPTAGLSGLFGRSTSASSGSIFGAAPAVGNSGTGPFGSTTPSTGHVFGSGAALFGRPAAASTSSAVLVGVY